MINIWKRLKKRAGTGLEEKDSKKGFDFSRYYPFAFTIIFVFILFQYSFNSLEAIFYDLRVRFDFGIGFKDNIVLITMDEESDQFLGETYPYTFASHDRLLKRLIKDEPKVINYFAHLVEAEAPSDIKSMDEFKTTINDFVSGGGGFRFGTDIDAWGEQLPPKSLRSLGYSKAIINIDNSTFAKDDVSRRAIVDISGERSLHLWTANHYRETQGLEPLGVKDILGSYYVREADATFTLFRYYTSPIENRGRIKKIPFHRVMVGNFPKGFFTDKIVLLGPSYISNMDDYVLTPFSKEETRSPRLALHAQIIESFVQNKTVYQIPKNFTYALCVIVAIFLSLTISRTKPTTGLLITLALMLAIFFISYLLFSLFGLWLYLTHLVLTVFVVYYIWVPFRAIGEYQRRYAIQEETKLLKKVENLKQNFISLMSHDLKTPVAKIAGIADVTLQQHGSDPNVRKNLHTIIDSTKELNKFITSILDLTKIESSNLNINTVSKDVNTIIEQVVDGLKFEAKNKDIRIETELSPLYPIEFDLELIKRVISNLVENAIKYSGEGSTIEIKTWDDEKWVTIEIKDNGVGIPGEDIDHIFEKFYRVKNDASHSIKGSGLGLYLVKYFVELHGGQITASSHVGQGTTFTVKLINR